jgi:CBS-domain-containing membrane protein
MRTWLVKDVMTVDVATVRETTPYRDIANTLALRRVSALPVIDKERRVIGVVSEADLLHKIEHIGEASKRLLLVGRRRRRTEQKAHGMLARELMTAPAITVAPGTTLTGAARLMEELNVKRLPVVDVRGRLVGIVARGDLLRVYLRPDPVVEREVTGEVLGHILMVEPGRVTVSVHKGVVTLTGRTDRLSTARLAVKLTAAVPGVVEVIDRLGFDFDDRKLAEANRFAPNPLGAP